MNETPPRPRLVSPAGGMTGNQISPDDPLYAVQVMVEGLLRQQRKEMGELVTKLTDDVAASSVLAERAARARAEQIVTEAGNWAADHIRLAGDQVAGVISVQRFTLEQAQRAFLRTLWMKLLFAALIAGSSAGILLTLVLRSQSP